MFCPQCGKNLPYGSIFCSGCGKKIPSSNTGFNPEMNLNKGLETPKDDAVYRVKGARGKHIVIYNNKCVITTKVTIGSIIVQNATDGEKTIYYKDCVGIQFKKSGFTVGYLQLETSTGMMNNRGSNFFSENSFTYTPSRVSNEKMQEIANFIKKRIDEIKTQGDVVQNVVSSISPADELKKFKELLEAGTITQEEFDAKKKQLLGI